MEDKKYLSDYFILISVFLLLVSFLLLSIEDLFEWKFLFIVMSAILVVTEIIIKNNKLWLFRNKIDFLKKDFDYLKNILDSIPVPLFLYNSSRHIMFSNSAASKLTGKSQDELKNILFNDLQINTPDKFLVFGENDKKSFEIVRIPFNAADDVNSELAILCDVTIFLNKIKDLENEKEKFSEDPLHLFIKSLMKNSDGIIYLKEKGASKVFANDFTLRLFDVLRSEDLLYNDVFLNFSSEDEGIMRNGNSHYRRSVIEVTDETKYYSETFKIPVTDEKTGFAGMICISGNQHIFQEEFSGFVPDIVNRLRDENSIHKRNKMLEKASESIDSAFWEYDVETSFIKFSLKFGKIISLSSNLVMDLNFFMSKVHLEDRYDLRNLFASSVNENKAFNMKIRMIEADSDIKWLDFSAAPVTDNTGKVTALSGMAINITDAVNDRLLCLAANKRLARENAMLGMVSVNEILENSKVETLIMKVTQAVAEGLDITSVGFWFINHTTRLISNVDKYIKEEKIHMINENKGIIFDDFLYSYIEDVKVFCVEDVPLFSNQMTEESLLKEIKKEGIKSAMLIGVRVSGKVVGILSVQDCDSTRIWFEDEKNFAISMGDFISLGLEARKCRDAGV